MRHHEVMYHFKPFVGELPAIYSTDFLGTRMRHEFASGMYSPQGNPVHSWYPELDEEYFEWIDLLEAVVEARDSFTMVDLGAGYGRWSVRAGCAVRQYHSDLPFHLVAVEAEPLKFHWMHRHFEDNGLDPRQHKLVHAAVNKSSGPALFCIGGPVGSAFDLKPDEWYGQALTKEHDIDGASRKAGEYYGFEVQLHESQWRSISVQGISLSEILEDEPFVDLVDMDIEGDELPVVAAAVAELDAKVKRLHIGTHGRDIEAGLRRILCAHGWRCKADYSLGGTHETDWGPIDFCDGAQSWVNPRF